MPERLANDFQTTVGAGGITNVATSLPVSAAAPAALRNAAGLAADFTIRVEDADGSGKPAGTSVEFMRVTSSGAAGISPWTVTRQSEDSARFPAVAHAAGSIVSAVYTAGTMQATLDMAAVPDWSAAMEGLLVHTFDPTSSVTNVSGGSGEVFLVRCPCPQEISPVNQCIQIHTAGSGLTLARLGVYKADGTKLGHTGDLSSAFTTTGFKSAALIADAGLTKIGGASPIDNLLLAIVQIGTTPARFFAKNGMDTNMANANLSGLGLRFMKGTGFTDLPTSAQVTTANFPVDASNRLAWMGLS